MNFLLDTQLLLWSQSEQHRIPQWLVVELEKPKQPPAFSVISIWEIVIKAQLKKIDFNYDPHLVRSTLIDLGWQELLLTSDHVLAVRNLSSLHGDPFDRALVAQAKSEGLEFITADRTLKDYGPHVRLI